MYNPFGGNKFSYTNYHGLNLDWIIEIAKNFLDQYSHIQETITTGLDDLQTKADNLTALLQEWYDQHSSDIADQLAEALSDLNAWYEQHQDYLDESLSENIAAFNEAAETKAAQTIASIPADYTALADQVNEIDATVDDITSVSQVINMPMEQGGISSTGEPVASDILIRTVTGFNCSPGESITLVNNSFEYRIFGLYQGNMQIIKDYDQGDSFTFSVNKEGVKIVLRRRSLTNLSPSDVDLNDIFITTINAIIEDVTGLAQDKVYPLITKYMTDHQNNMNLLKTGYDFENMIWSWWNYPQVISRDYIRNQVYFGFTNNNGDSGVAFYNFNTGEKKQTILKHSDIDDHNAPAVFVTDIGKIIAAYSGGHNTDKQMHIRISKSLENIDNFENVIDIDYPGWTTYAQMIKSGNYYYLFCRVDDVSWYYIRSEDLRNWSSPQKIIDTSTIQYYVKFMPTTNNAVIRMVMYSNPSEGHTEIRQGFINTQEHKVYNSDNATELGNDTTRYQYTAFEVLIPTTTGKVNRLFDVAVTAPNDTNIAFCTFTPNLPDDSEYYVYKNGVNKKVADGGTAFWIPKYQGGVSFITSDKVVISRSHEGEDLIEIYEFNGSTWNRSELVYEANNYNDSQYPIRNVRPIVDIHQKILFWHSGYYNSSDFTLFDCDAKFAEL